MKDDHRNRWHLRSLKSRKEYLDNLQKLMADDKAIEKAVISPIEPRSLKSGTQGRGGKKKRLYNEFKEQRALVTWVRMKGLPIIRIGNDGLVTMMQRVRAYQAGLYKGALDLFLMKGNRRYNGFWIEMKEGTEKPTKEQMEFMERAKNEGYHADWFNNWEKAKEAIEAYLRDV